MNNDDVRTLGQLANEVIDCNCSLKINTLPNLAAKILMVCHYWKFNQPTLSRFDGKQAYLELHSVFIKLESEESLPLSDLLDQIDYMVWAIRDLEKTCGITTED